MDKVAHSASKKVAAVGRELRYFEYRIKKKAQQQKSKNVSSTKTKLGPKRLDNSEVEASRPQTIGEEDLQLQLALEMSKAESDNTKKDTKQEDIRLKLAIQESLKKEEANKKQEQSQSLQQTNQSSLLDLGDPWAATQPQSTPQTQTSQPLQPPTTFKQPADPFASAPVATNVDPFGLGMPMGNSQPQQVQNADPWGSVPVQAPPSTAQNNVDPWGNTPVQEQQPVNNDPFNMNGVATETNAISNGFDDPFGTVQMGEAQQGLKNSIQPVNSSLSHQFLGGLGADLVNLDSLGLTAPATTAGVRGPSPTNLVTSTNPFASGVQQNTGNVFSGNIQSNNPFATNALGPTLNQLKAEQTTTQDSMAAAFSGIMQPTSSQPVQQNNQINPFF